MAIALRHNDFGHFRVDRVGRQIWALRATCKSCHKQTDLDLTGGKGTLSQSFAEKGFRNKGWEVGSDRRKDRCPDCIEAEIKARREAQNKAIAMSEPVQTTHIPLHVPPVPVDTLPRQKLNRPIDWEPSQEEIREMLKDGARAVGSDPKCRREGLTYYPAITRGAETMVRSIIETRIRKKPNGYFGYEEGWNDHSVAALISRLYPGVHASYMMARVIRTQWFGYSQQPGYTRTASGKSRAYPNGAPPTAPDLNMEPAAAAAAAAPAAAPEPVPPPPAPTVAHETGNAARGPFAERVERTEKDLIHLFEELEKVKAQSEAHLGRFKSVADSVTALLDRVEKLEANRGWNQIHHRLEKLEESVRKFGEPAKSIDDYSIAELLAEIAKRTSQAA